MFIANIGKHGGGRAGQGRPGAAGGGRRGEPIRVAMK